MSAASELRVVFSIIAVCSFVSFFSVSESVLKRLALKEATTLLLWVSWL